MQARGGPVRGVSRLGAASMVRERDARLGRAPGSAAHLPLVAGKRQNSRRAAAESVVETSALAACVPSI
ncbi:MAG: hypothetical protein GTO43_05540 [Armatimonadetes bacterium]|nr:hypothetical protein [Armatimonadota bacterium]NIN05828.1 hypothetical protein [Armatimonadota bacterium]NIT31176.1 hypothetical protein [Armatimonadota bacterium]